MNRTAKLALIVWAAVGASIALSFLFWRIWYIRPHAFWAVLSVATISFPMMGLAWCVVRGPNRLRALGWLLIGATPLVWLGTYFTNLSIVAKTRAPIAFNAPLRTTMTWVSSILDLEARWRYPRWTHGQHSVLMDAGQTPDADRLVEEMDDHLEAMAKLLGKSVPDDKFPWVRGSLVWHNRRAIGLWALCGLDDNPSELTYLDRHENAHTLMTALAGPDHDPPFVLLEGWAETQSADRDSQISSLAQKRKDGRAYSLEELVDPFWYGKGSGPVYWQGGPLVHYLLEHYGGEKFFEFYSGIRRSTFLDDCQAILGDSWESVENEFWKWIELEAQLIAENNPQESAETEIEFADSVNPVDWQAMVSGYRKVVRDNESLPTNQTFLVELDRVVTDQKTGLDKQPFHVEFRAVFRGDDFWVTENYSRNQEQFLLLSKERCAYLLRDEDGVMEGWVKDHHAFRAVREETVELMRSYLSVSNLADLLPLTDRVRLSTWEITDLVRPKDGSGEPWSISYTTIAQVEGEEVERRNEVKVDPALDWAVVRYAVEEHGEWNFESKSQYQRLNGAIFPSSSSTYLSEGNDQVVAEVRVRPLTESEQIEIIERVEQAANSAPLPRFHKLKSALMAMVFLCPLCGVLLLGVSKSW